MVKRYVRTLMGRLKKVDTVDTSFDYQGNDELQQEIVAALTFWKFYENLYEHAKGVKNLPEDFDVLRHELLEHVVQEDALRGFIACWLRLPETVMETLKWTANLDIQSREAFLRRLDETQIQAVRVAYREFFVEQRAPSCLRDGWFRERVHRDVTYESLQQEYLLSSKRTESKSAWGRPYAHMDFGHAKYPDGPDVDTPDSGSFRKFLSVKNHTNDFSVNQHDGLYWWLYRTLRSNYIWNRRGDVELKPMICPGFWFTILSWMFFTIVSPVFAFTTFFPLLTGAVGMSWSIFFGSVVGAITPIILLLYGIFYFFRDSKTIEWISSGLDSHFSRFGHVWAVCAIAVVIAFLHIALLAMSAGLYNDTQMLAIAAIPFVWIIGYWAAVIKMRSFLFEPSGRVFFGLIAASTVLVALPFTTNIISAIGALIMGIIVMFTFFALQFIAMALICLVTWLVYKKMDHLNDYQYGYQSASPEQVMRDHKGLIALGCLAACVYVGIILYALSSFFVESASGWHIFLAIIMIAMIGGSVYAVLYDAYTMRRTDADLLVRRHAYIKALRDAGVDSNRSSFTARLMYNHWVINHENPAQVATDVRNFARHLVSPVHGIERQIADVVIQSVSAQTAKHFASYDGSIVYDAARELGEQAYLEFAVQAVHGYTPEQALKKARKYKSRLQGNRDWWKNTFPVRVVMGFFTLIKTLGAVVVKVVKDLFGMWEMFHRYCPAVADTKQI